jgi:translation initiation factor IF-2
MSKETLKNISIKAEVKTRPPIVVVMGHVDHGKTTLLDYIRKANIAAREAGGITQATAAYEIEHRPAGAGAGDARRITFIDTPGHEAFTAMRSRGAQVADLAILVIAADEGVKPQTKEAIKIIEEAKTPFVVAINKVDKTGGSVDKARNDLMAAGVLLEGYGGQVSYCAVSAKTGAGVDDLLDLVLLAADMENLTYDASAPASGFVLEAKRDPKRGIEAAVIIKNGTLVRGDVVRTHTASGKVKILENFLGKTAANLTPSAPAIIIGFEKIPKVGEEFSAGELAEKAVSPVRGSVVAAVNQISKSKPNTLNLILKAGDAGSLEALSVVLRGIDQKGGKEINIVEEGVGDITDGDIRHAIATKATIIGFKNRVEKGARVLADAQTVTVITSEIVYDLATAVEEYFSGARGPAAAGELEVLALFNQEKPQKQLVGGRVINGTFRGKSSFDVVRGHVGSTPVGGGKVLGLRENKSEIFQADKGKEIGVLLDSQTLVQVGDKLLIRK